MAKPIPRKGSKLHCQDDIIYRWIAYSTPKGTEVRMEYNEAPGTQMLIAQVPKIFDLRWIEHIIDFGLDNGWMPGEDAPAITIRKTKTSYRIIEDEE